MQSWRTLLFSKSANLIDGWSIPHFLFGSVMALGALVFDWSLPIFFGLTVGIAFLWEYVEIKIIGIKETWANMVADVVLPLMAFWITSILVLQAGIDSEHRQALLVITLMVYVFANLMAWRARLNHDHEFMG